MRLAQLAGFSLLTYIALAHGQRTLADPIYTYVSFDEPRGAGSTTPTSINNLGQVIGGYFEPSTSQFLSFLRSPNGSYTTLTGLSPTGDTFAKGINDLGQIVGFSRGSAPSASGFLRQADGSYTAVNFPNAQGGNTYNASINNAGQIVGDYGNGGTGFLRNPDGTFIPINAGDVSLSDINNVGQIVGSNVSSSGFASACRSDYFVSQGFIRAPNGSFTNVNLPGATGGLNPLGINASGQIVGRERIYDSNFCNETDKGFVLNPDGSYFFLTAPNADPNQTIPYGINDLGQIVGTFENTTGIHGFIATPQASTIPEPTSIVILGTGFIGLAMTRRRRTE